MTPRARPALDVTAVTGGAFRGFWVLLVGGLLQPFSLALPEAFALLWLPMVALAAFVAAAWVATGTQGPPGQGPAAALASYLMVLPLVVIGTGQLPVLQFAGTAVLAVLTGVLVSLVRGPHLRRDPVS